ncbi:glycosyltransferase family 4 protein [Bifidobacterium catenulatum]|uniref:Spore coat protein n=1 Tax=Bifidobacterium catenulatum PV20-2 TaxID=1447716 RepID=A0A0A7I796_9BIFI|nr:glycosyltransferase family 4 protein [Bifidobacterium catenulatum]AIZ15090.1 spore coat protein [Bifidobacterium catenulatum PV20-2]
MNPHVAVITSGYLPVPNVLGGAVEALDMMMVQENEKTPNFDFTVFSSWAPGVDQIARKGNFKHTDFCFIKTPLLVCAVDHCIYWAAKHVLHKKKLMSYRYIAQRLWYINKVSKKLAQPTKNGSPAFDKVMIENHATLFMTMQKHGNSERYAEKVYYHLHNEVLNDFGCIKEISKVKKILGVSKYIVDTLDTYLREHGEPGLREDQKAVWRNGVDTSRFGSEEANSKAIEFRKKFNIAENDIVFLFSGRLTPEKGAEELLKAFTEVAQKVPNAKLVVAGAFFFNSNIISPFEQKLRDLASNPTVKNRIIFTGFVNYEDMPAIYAMSDICVLPSIWDDPAPLAVIESLVSGKPLITTRSGGIPEYADAQSAIILERSDQLVGKLAKSMVKLATDIKAYQSMASYEGSIRTKLDEKAYTASLSELMR